MKIQFLLPAALKAMKQLFFMLFAFFCFYNTSFAQVTFKVNALADLEFSVAGESSHYYYNEIDQDHTDPRIGLTQLNLIGQIDIDKHWSFNTRLLLERDKGKTFDKFAVPLLNVQWLSTNRKYGLTLGNFTNPFGSFNKMQLSTERNFVGLPLAYAFYHNISDKIGFVEGLGDVTKLPVDGDVQWGTSNIYYGGYTRGALFSWNIKPAKVNWKLALVTGASNLQKRFTDPIHVGLISRLKIQPTYFWEQGFSLSHGTFFQASEFSYQLEDLGAFTQTIIGMDYKLGFGYFEFSGELMSSFYKVPQFNGEQKVFETGTQKLSNLSAYLDAKYEPPVLQGSYVAYRIDHLGFSKLDGYEDQNWDNNVLRHSIVIGYHVHKNVLVRAAVSTQQVDNKKWDKTQRTLRVVLTAHY